MVPQFGKLVEKDNMTLNPIKWYTGIRELFAIKGAISNMKLSELSTSSGRMVWVMSLAGVISVGLGFLPAVLVAKITAVLATAYIVYRTVAPVLESLAKMTPTPKDDAVLAEIAEAVKALTDKYGTPSDTAATIGKDNVKTE